MKPIVPTSSVALLCAALALAGGLAPALCAARDHVETFDDDRPTWKLELDPAAARARRHLRTAEVVHEGRGAELVEVDIGAALTVLALTHELPCARAIDELKLSLWFRSNQDGATLSARVVFPNQLDPQTGQPLTRLIDGDAYTTPGQWQELTLTGLERRVRQMLPQLRRQLQVEAGFKGDLDARGVYVDAAVVNVQTSRGTSRFVMDDLHLGPIVEAVPAKMVRQTREERELEPEALFHLTQLFVRGRPFFPRILPYHQEQPADLARMGFNVVWVPDYRDTGLLEELDHAGLRAMAIPPREPEAGSHLAPFGPETSHVLFWYLGTRIGPEKRTAMSDWQEQIRSADRAFNRPLMGDVTGLERTYSRQLSMLGVSRPAVQTSFGLKSYRDWLLERRNLAQPGKLLWTWIQTEPAPAVDETREAAGWAPQVVEPEQLRLEVYAALAAGCRGIGFWTHSSLDESRPGALERKLMLKLLNMELELLEPLLATGSLSGQTSFTVQQQPTRNLNQAASPSMRGSIRDKEMLLNEREIQLRKRDQLKRDLEAAVIGVPEAGMLVLPVWYAEEAQYVPGQMAANEARLVVPGAGESARAYLLTTTDVYRLEHERVTGGREVKLPKFDMTAAILVTEDESLIERFREKTKQLREPAARVSIELARAKLERVAAVDADLRSLGRTQPDSGRILAKTRNLIDEAQTQFRAQRFHDARLAAADALQLLRLLQHTHWSDAVRRLYAPVTSPHTLCFQTLPDHWKMLGRLGRTRTDGNRNVLRSGDFEDFETMKAEGWTQELMSIDGIRANAEQYPRAHSGTYSLRLIATPAPGEDPPVLVPERPVAVTSPPVTVYKGQLVYIGGWVKVAAPSLGNLDGAMLYDSLGGPTAALRWRTTADWKQFELVREVPETCELTVTMALAGLGEIRFDDLQIIPLDVDPNQPGASKAAAGRPGKSSPFDFLRRIPGFGGKTDPE